MPFESRVFGSTLYNHSSSTCSYLGTSDCVYTYVLRDMSTKSISDPPLFIYVSGYGYLCRYTLGANISRKSFYVDASDLSLKCQVVF